MAESGSWPSLQRHGLLSTSALLDLFQVSGSRREAIESSRRAESVAVSDPRYGTVWIRDNKPINERVLQRTLVGMTEAEWYRTLNSRVFFWLTESRLERLRTSSAYRDRRHDILTVDTVALLNEYAETVELAHLNSGAVHPGANYPRGVGTFSTIAEYPWSDRVAVAPREPIVELTIPYAVTDIGRFVVDVTTR